MADWLHIENDATGGTADVPDDDGIRESYEARGWRVVDAPADPAAAPAADGEIPGYASDAGWVDLGHPDTSAVHRFPADPAALAGAHDAGWTALNKDGSIPKRQKPLDAALEAPAAADPAPPEIPDAAAAPEKTKRPAPAADTKEQ